MAYKEHGAPLTQLVPQPGARFSRTKAGFDVGRRQFKIDQSYAWLRAPLIDSRDLVYPMFYVSAVDVTEERNGLATVDVDYLGVTDIHKPPAIVGDTSSEQFTREGWVLTEATPSVTFTYVQSTRPDPWQPGQPAAPPGFSAPSSSLKSPYYAGTIIDFTIVFEGWVLKARSYRQAGPFWEVTDSYEYVRIRSQPEEA